MLLRSTPPLTTLRTTLKTTVLRQTRPRPHSGNSAGFASRGHPAAKAPRRTAEAGPCCYLDQRHERSFSSTSPTSSTPVYNTRPTQPTSTPRTHSPIEAPRTASPSATRNLHSATPPGMYTTSFAFFEAIWEAGITHCFVNLGSDHPSIIEAMVKGQREKKGSFPRIITCPNEASPFPLSPGTSLTCNKYEDVQLTYCMSRWSQCQWQTATPA